MNKGILEEHQTVDLNVFMMENVRATWLVFVRNVQIPVKDLVALIQTA